MSLGLGCYGRVPLVFSLFLLVLGHDQRSIGLFDRSSGILGRHVGRLGQGNLLIRILLGQSLSHLGGTRAVSAAC